MPTDVATHLNRSCDLGAKVSRVLQTRAKLAQDRLTSRLQASFAEHVSPLLSRPLTPWDLWSGWARYAVDVGQRSVLLGDTLRQRGNAFVEHTRKGLPPVLHFAS